MTDPIAVKKHGFRIGLGFESTFDLQRAADRMRISLLASLRNMEREVAERKVTPPSEAQRAEFARITALLEEVRASEFWEEGFDGGYLREPEDKVEITYAETWEEFSARVESAGPFTAEDLAERFHIRVMGAPE